MSESSGRPAAGRGALPTMATENELEGRVPEAEGAATPEQGHPGGLS